MRTRPPIEVAGLRSDLSRAEFERYWSVRPIGSSGRPRASTWPLVALSFLPGAGLLFAALAVLASRGHPRRQVAVFLSVLGSLVTLVPLISFVGVRILGLDAGALEAQAQANLQELGLVLERFEARSGRYPEDLDEALGVAELSALAFDPISPKPRDATRGAPYQYLFYRALDEGGRYHLFSRGRDGLPYTRDDVYPRDVSQLPGFERPERGSSPR